MAKKTAVSSRRTVSSARTVASKQPKAAKKSPVRKRRRRRAARPDPTRLLGQGAPVIFEPKDYERARRALMREPLLAPIVKHTGRHRFHALQEGELFSALVETIISQQLSVRVADVIFGRLVQLCASTNGGALTPEILRDMDPALLRTAGLSQAKAASIQDLAAKVADGTLDLHVLATLPDDEVMRLLCQVKGIGPWSAHMILIFRLNRPDIWPIGDLGIVRALQRLHGWPMRKMPSYARLLKAGEIWRPYRSVAAWYLWHSLSVMPSAGAETETET